MNVKAPATATLSDIEQARLFAALADPARVRLVRELAAGEEKSGTEIANNIDVSLALLCHHSRILVDAGVISKRKQGQTTYYKANTPLLQRALRDLLACDAIKAARIGSGAFSANAATRL